MDFVVVFGPAFMDRPGKVNFGNEATADISLKTLSLRLELQHHFWAADAVRVTREILNFIGSCKLATWL